MSEKKFAYDSLQDAATIGAFIGALNDGFASGRIALSANGDEIVLSPRGLLNFSVKAKRKSGEGKLTIKVSWKDARFGSGQDGASPLSVES